MRLVKRLAGMGILLAAYMTSAQAQLSVCNQTDSEVQVAVGESQGLAQPFRSHGWFNFAPGECAAIGKDALRYTKQFYYARYRDRSKSRTWEGNGQGVYGCVNPEGDFDDTADECAPPNKRISYVQLNTGAESSHTIYLREESPLDFSSPAVQAQACEILNNNLDRPRLRPEAVKLGSYTDPFTLPHTRSECTSMYDTGVPDIGTATSVWDPCESEMELPFGGWTCVPGWTIRTTNIKACNAWKVEKQWMECDLQFQIKLPNYIENPLSDFIDNSYEIAENMRQIAATSLPLQCAPRTPAGAGDNVTQQVASQIAAQLKTAAVNAIRREGEEWLKETAIKTIIASIPSGGVGGPAVMSTELGQFVIRVQRVLKPIIKVANDAKNLAEDVGFSTSCGWGAWSRF
jgi:uncharacterized membrane protein